MHPKKIHFMLHADKLHILGAVLEFKNEQDCIIWGAAPTATTLADGKKELESLTKAPVFWHTENV